MDNSFLETERLGSRCLFTEGCDEPDVYESLVSYRVGHTGGASVIVAGRLELIFFYYFHLKLRQPY